MSDALIPVMRPIAPPLELVTKYLESAWSAGRFSNYGPLVQELERRYADRLGTDPDLVIACSSATTALTGAIVAHEAHRALVQNYSFPATGHAALSSGKEVTFSNRLLNWKMPDVQYEGVVCVPVVPFGAQIDEEIITRHNMVLDAAASLGQENAKFSSLSESSAVVFSLHATKVLGAGEGGLAIFGGYQAAKKFREWINFGFSNSRSSLRPATNGKMSEATAAIALAALDNWAVERSQWLAARNRAMSTQLKTIKSPSFQTNDCVTPYWIVQLESAERVSLLESFLRLRGIESRKWWDGPMSLMPAFSKIQVSPSASEEGGDYEKLLGLPFFRELSDKDFAHVNSALWDFELLHS